MATSSTVPRVDSYTSKRILAWIAKNIFVPLLPFGIGALIRSLSGVEGSREIFDAGELCFSMAMLSMFVISSASRLDDKDLRDGITNAFVVFVVLFIVLFAFTSGIKAQIQSDTSDLISKIRNPPQTGVAATLDKFTDGELHKFSSMLSKVWIWAIVPSVLAIVSAMICKFRYRLED